MDKDKKVPSSLFDFEDLPSSASVVSAKDESDDMGTWIVEEATGEKILDADSLKSRWEKALAYFGLLFTPKVVSLWFEPIKPRRCSQKELVLHVPSDEFARYLENNFEREISMMLDSFFLKETMLSFYYPKEEKPVGGQIHSGADSMATSNDKRYSLPLDEKFQIHLFFEGDSNRMARKMAQGLANRPGQPGSQVVVFYGACGIGKTHLSQAIAWGARELHPNKRVAYLPTTEFQHLYTEDARNGTKGNFLKFYQERDILILDDIQFLKNKEKTQQAFFEIFNHLIMLGKQIILTCDTPPSELNGLEGRIISRLKGAIWVEINLPDAEIRRQVIRHHFNKSELLVEDEIIEYMAQSFGGGIREVQGTVESIIFQAKTLDEAVTIDLVRATIGKYEGRSSRPVVMKDIIEAVVEVCAIEEKKLLGECREVAFALPRHLVVYLTRKHTDLSWKAIASGLKRTSHSTAINSDRRIKERLKKSDIELEGLVDRIENVLKQI